MMLMCIVSVRLCVGVCVSVVQCVSNMLLHCACVDVLIVWYCGVLLCVVLLCSIRYEWVLQLKVVYGML